MTADMRADPYELGGGSDGPTRAEGELLGVIAVADLSVSRVKQVRAPSGPKACNPPVMDVDLFIDEPCGERVLALDAFAPRLPTWDSERAHVADNPERAAPTATTSRRVSTTSAGGPFTVRAVASHGRSGTR